jgi:CBS domain-containing protein
VVDEGRVLGLVTLEHVRKVAGEQWRELAVSDVMAPAESLTVEPSTTLIEVLERMTQSGTDRVVVSEYGHLLGVISASDVTRRVLKAQVSAELSLN